MYHSFFIQLSVSGHLGCFHVLTLINSAALNRGVHVFFSILVSLGYMPSSGIGRSYGGFIPSFLRNLHTDFHGWYYLLGCINLHSHQQRRRAPFLEKTLESPLDSKEIKPVNSKGNQPWIFIGRTDAEAEAPIFWPPDVKSWLIRKDPDAGKDWKQEKGTTKDKVVGWHNWLNRDESEQILGDNEGQGSLVCPWGHRVRHDLATEQL